MSALETAKALGREAVLEKIKASGLKDYGLKADLLSERIAGVSVGAVDVGLNNADTDKLLLALLRETPEKVFEGIAVAAFLVDAVTSALYLPADETELAGALKESAEAYGITIVYDIINVRDTEDHLLMHIVTAADLADLLDGCYSEGVFVSADGGTLKKVPADTKLTGLVSLDGAKMVGTGYRYYTPAEAEELTAADVLNGCIRVFGEKDCVVQAALKQLGAYRNVSCGRCVFCREGLIQLEYMQKEISSARGRAEYMDLTAEIGDAMCGNTLCTIGQESAKAALDATQKYADEYQAHIRKNKCPAGACSAFVHIYIDPQACTGCGECMDVCPKECIEGKAKYIHMIDEFDCTKCGKCMEVCEEDAIILTAGKLPKLPNRLTKVGKFRKH